MNYRGIIRILLVGFIVVCISCSYIHAQNKTAVYSMKATYYHDKFENRKTSSGVVFSQKLYTAAHRTLPLHTVVKVMNKRTGKSVLVKITTDVQGKVL